MKTVFFFLFLTVQAFAGFTGGGAGVNCSSGTNGQVYTTNGSACSFTTVAGTGTVTSVNTDSTTSSILTNTANVIGTITPTLTLLTQAANKALLGPTTGAAAVPAFRLLVGADLPNPSASTLGGVQSAAAVSHQWINTISTSGVPGLTQPAFSDISGSVASTQMPALTSDVTSSAGAVVTTVAKIQGTTVSGTTGTGNVVFSASPTLTGTAVLASATVSGSLKAGNCHLEPAETDIGNSGASQSVDLSTANVFTSTLTANSTFTLSNPVAGCPYVFVLTQDGTGSRTLTIAGVTTIWGNSGSKTLSTVAASVDKISCVYNGNITKLMCDLSTAYQ